MQSVATRGAVATRADQDRFTAILGHELRSRLQPTKNAAELLKRDTLDASTRRSLAELIDRQIDGMTRLIDDLLDVARLRAGVFRLRRTPTEISEVIGHALETVRPFLATRNHTLIATLPCEPVYLEADVTWLSQALQNLLNNAGKYTNPNGTIGIRAERDADDVVITVSDNGIGIDLAELDTIFELYAQGSQAGSERSARGIGLGLYLSRLVAEGHGGVIRAFSAGPGRGSQFTVRLPLRTS